MLMSPAWTMALLKNGIPRFANLRPYVGENASINDIIAFARREMGGAFTWDEVALPRPLEKPLIVKGIMHPQDAEKAVSLGVDGMFVSNHGGRQIEALPAPIDVLPAIVKQVGKRATVLYRFRHPQRHRRGARLALGAARGVCRQGVPVGPRRARRGRRRATSSTFSSRRRKRRSASSAR